MIEPKKMANILLSLAANGKMITGYGFLGWGLVGGGGGEDVETDLGEKLKEKIIMVFF
jgi:hypothetical protein